MAGEARIPFGPRLRHPILPCTELRDPALYIHWTPLVRRRADNRHCGAESYHHDRPTDLHVNRLAIEEHVGIVMFRLHRRLLASHSLSTRVRIACPRASAILIS